MKNKLITLVTLSFIAMLIVTTESRAEEQTIGEIDKTEIAATSSIYAVTYVEIPINTSLPERVWHTRGKYGGYLTLESYERTPDFTYKGKYTGYLRYMVAPNKVDEEV